MLVDVNEYSSNRLEQYDVNQVERLTKPMTQNSQLNLSERLVGESHEIEK